MTALQMSTVNRVPLRELLVRLLTKIVLLVLLETTDYHQRNYPMFVTPIVAEDIMVMMTLEPENLAMIPVRTVRARVQMTV